MTAKPENSAPETAKKIDVPTSEEFTRALGQACWLLTLSKEHRTQEIASIESQITAPLMFKQLRVFSKGKQPLAALTWAYASDAVRDALAKGGYTMQLQDWRSGPHVTVVACISPLVDGQKFIDVFLAEVKAAENGRNSSAKDA